MPLKFNKLILILEAVIGLCIIMTGVALGQQTQQAHMIGSPVDDELLAGVLSSAQVQAVVGNKRLDAEAWNSLEKSQKIAILKVLFAVYLSCDGALSYIVTDNKMSEFRKRDYAEVMFDQVVTFKFSGRLSGVAGLTTGFIIDLNAFKKNTPTLVYRRWPGNEWSALTIRAPNPGLYKEFCRVLTGLTEKGSQ
jgi:hypothetical protein